MIEKRMKNALAQYRAKILEILGNRFRQPPEVRPMVGFPNLFFQAISYLLASRHAISLIAGVALSSNQARADAGAYQCPEPWKDYTSVFVEKSRNTAPQLLILFSDRDGKIYNCLNMSVQQDLLNKLQTIQMSLPYDREAEIGDDPSTWPLNICRVSQINDGAKTILIVNLPTDPEVLARETCQLAIKNSNFLGK